MTPSDLLELVGALVEESKATDGAGRALDVLDALVTRVPDLIENADWASITVVPSRGRPHSIAASHPQALMADKVQYRIGSGPCLEAALQDHQFVIGEIHTDKRWLDYGRAVHRELGVTSMLTHHLTLLGDYDVDAALNVYARKAKAFNDDAVREGVVLATQCSLLVTAHLANDRAENLVTALTTNREIGTAMGILMSRHRITAEQAFAALRITSQDRNKRVADLATEVVQTGDLDLSRPLQVNRQP